MSKKIPPLFFLLLLHSLAQADSVPGAAGSIEITTLLHAGVQLEYRGTVVQVDPWDRLRLPDAKPADLILISDDPGHHLDVDAIERLRKPGASVVLTAAGKQKWPDGIVVANGETVRVAGVTVESIAAYDIIQGNPSHPKGDANGYVVTLGGKKFFFAGVTECVDEVKALQGIDVAFMPMNIPLARMTPAAAAACTLGLNPAVVYLYHYDQDYARRAQQPDYVGTGSLPDGLTVAESLGRFAEALDGSGIEFRRGEFYPPLD